MVQHTHVPGQAFRKACLWQELTFAWSPGRSELWFQVIARGSRLGPFQFLEQPAGSRVVWASRTNRVCGGSLAVSVPIAKLPPMWGDQSFVWRIRTEAHDRAYPWKPSRLAPETCSGTVRRSCSGRRGSETCRCCPQASLVVAEVQPRWLVFSSRLPKLAQLPWRRTTLQQALAWMLGMRSESMRPEQFWLKLARCVEPQIYLRALIFTLLETRLESVPI